MTQIVIDPYGMVGKRTKDGGVILSKKPGVEGATRVDELMVPPADNQTLDQAGRDKQDFPDGPRLIRIEK